MLSVAEVLERLMAAAEPVTEEESVAVMLASNRVLAKDIVAPLSVPPADNSAMDGYAYRLGDAASRDFILPVSQRVAAGQVPQPLATGSAARIFTGAEIPAGADTVAIQEDCQVGNDGVTLPRDARAGDNIRAKGQDVRQGERVLIAGTRLRAQETGLLASLGISHVPVRRTLRVGVLTSGDELVEPGQALGPGQIYNSNHATLAGLLAAWGMNLVDLGRVPDRPEAIADRLREGTNRVDIVVTTGGVSVGEEDHIKAVVETMGHIALWKVAIKPGKPLAFGKVLDKPFIGLPGNPSSVFVTALILLRPLLFRLQGCLPTSPPTILAPALFDRKAGRREEYLRARLTAEGIEIHPNQSSGVLSSACWGDGLAVQPAGQAVTRGDRLDFLYYSALY